MILFILLCLWFGQGQVGATENQNGTDAQQQSTQRPSPVEKRADTGQAGDSRQDKQNNSSRWSDPLVWLNFALFVAVLIQAGIYWMQLWEMRKTLAVLRRQTDTQETQASTMQGQLDAMKEQVEIMREQAKSMDQSVVFGLRAYVGVHSVGVDLITRRLFIQIENIGKVPASDVKVDVEMEVLIPYEFVPITERTGKDEGAIRSFRFPYHYRDVKLFPGSLKIMIRIQLERWLSDSDISLIGKGQAWLIVRGNINFTDGFNSGKDSRFSLRYDHEEDLWYPIPFDPKAGEKSERDRNNNSESPN